jgi:hypothetical protein
MARTRFRRGGVTVDMFFDRAKVLDRLEKKEARVLNKTGGEGRQTVKRSMRPGGKAGKTAAPGEPPRWQTKKLRDGIFYGYDASNRSVVIGPIRTSAKQRDVPRILDQGGPVRNALVRVKETRTPQELGVSATEAKKRKFRFVRASFTLQPRPYVSPRSVNYPKILEFFRKNLEQLPL